MTEANRKSLSKFMSLILRHDPAAAGVTLDRNGWADVDELLAGMNSTGGSTVTLEDIQEVVANNDKQRFTFNDDFTKIRANQGHSVQVDVELKETRPPVVLYHGTSSKFVQLILDEGLKPQGRLYVHLSANIETATKVGGRRGSPVVLVINTEKMHDDGFKFYLSENGVWLTDYVPADCLHIYRID
ncbi:MAG: RNA 2'-phosphotransferase [Oscillospiraceae bacterium]|nr:RNA 2'-phosphotransferase [Oscillospiraceae bacterium]